jgi:hypothetical protein
MAAQIEIGELLKCQNPKCQTEFRWVPHNSTIKPKFCPRCTALKKFEQDRITYNKKMLERSNLASYRSKFQQKRDKYPIKGKNGREVKKTTKQRAMTNADDWFSRYIRIKYAFKIQDGDVFCKCFIDPNVRPKHAKHFDNGHCFSRKFKLTRYEEDNCRPQNRSSNRFSGEADHYKFKDKLKKEIGDERFKRLDELRKQEGEDTLEFYQEQSDKYKKLTNELVKIHDIKKWW